MTNEPNEIDPRVRELLQRADPAPLGMTTRLEVGLTRRAGESGRLTATERACIVSICALLGSMGGPVATAVALGVGLLYTRFTVLVEA